MKLTALALLAISMVTAATNIVTDFVRMENQMEPLLASEFWKLKNHPTQQRMSCNIHLRRSPQQLHALEVVLTQVSDPSHAKYVNTRSTISKFARICKSYDSRIYING